MRLIKRLFISKDVKSLIDVISNTDDYPKNVDAKRDNDMAIAQSLKSGLIEEYMQSSGIVIGDTHFKHEAYRLTQKGKTLAISNKEHERLAVRLNKTYAWFFGVIGAVIAGLILYFLGAN